MFDAGAIVGKMVLDLHSWNSSVEKVKNNSTSLQGWILKNQAQVTQLGRSFTIAGAAISGAYALSAKSAISFESAFAGVRKTVDATEAEFSQLNKSLIDMSNEMPMSASNLAGIMEIAGQLGVRGVKDLTKFTETVAKISVTTNLTKEAAATDFARIANIMQEPLTNVDRMGAAIVDLGNNFATTEAEISAFAQRIAGSAKVVGLTTADIFGIGTAFSSVGVGAERGGTAVSKALIQIGEAIKTGNKDLKTFAQVSGMTTEEFARAFEQDAGQAFAKFIDGLGRGGLQAAQILEDLELGDQRLKQAFLSVGGAGGILTEALNKASNAWKENTALTEEARKRFATTQSILQKTWNTVANLATKIGDLLLPAINSLAQKISNIVIAVQKWVDNNKTLATVLTYAGVAVGVLLTVMGLLALALPGIIASMILFKTAVTGATISVMGLNLALGPVTIAIVAATAIIAAAILAVTKWQTVIGYLKAVWWSFAAGINDIMSRVVNAIASFLEKMERIPGIGKKFIGAAESMRAAADNLKSASEDCGKRTTEAFQDMDSAASTSLTGGAIDKINDAFNKLKDNVENNFTPKIEQSFDTWLRKANEDFSLMLEIGQGSLSTLQTGFSDIGMSIIGLGDDIRDVFSSLGNSIIRMFMDIAAKWLAMKAIMGITSAVGGLFSSGASTGVSSISSLSSSELSLGGFAEGIDSVPYTGNYRIHEGEKITPKYDATKESGGNVTVINYVTSDAINAAIAQKPDTVINVINSDTVRNGITRKTYKRYG